MPKKHASPPQEDDILVQMDVIRNLTDPPLARSTAYDWVKAGKIVKAYNVDGYYLLNATRAFLNLPPINIAEHRRQQQQLSKQAHNRQLHFLALTLVVPEALDVFSQEEVPESLTPEEADEVRAMSEQYFAELVENDIEDTTARLAFVGGVLKGLG